MASFYAAAPKVVESGNKASASRIIDSLRARALFLRTVSSYLSAGAARAPALGGRKYTHVQEK